jgi:hypothetical protein
MSDKIKIVHLEQTKTRIHDGTKIVRYMKLETLLLMLDEGLVFIPSHATLGRVDRLETGILFDLPDRWKFWENNAAQIEPLLHDFEKQYYLTVDYYNPITGSPIPNIGSPIPHAQAVQKHFRDFVNDRAVKRCVWCWNKFRYFSNALWQIYGNRGVAITSTVRKVKAALVKAGAVRGVVAPIAYINHEGTKVSKVLTKVQNILRPYLLKSIAYDYEKEIRFVLAAERYALEDQAGALIPIDAPDFIDDVELSPSLHAGERSAVERVIERLLDKKHKVNRKPFLITDWIRGHGTHFTDSASSDLL